MIVDDGSHNPTYQMDALNYLWEALKPGGVYIIEVRREVQCTALYCLAMYCSVLRGRALALGLCVRQPGDPSALPCLAFPCSGARVGVLVQCARHAHHLLAPTTCHNEKTEKKQDRPKNSDELGGGAPALILNCCAAALLPHCLYGYCPAVLPCCTAGCLQVF
jgi:hypothetical protein